MIKRCVWTEPDDGAGRLSQNYSDTSPLRTGTTRIITHMRLALPLPTLPHLFPPPTFLLFYYFSSSFEAFSSIFLLHFSALPWPRRWFITQVTGN